ncbi:unnamed protein product [Phytophthora fragariaefolia]|uniref:Unnamed protein product n=1 Tax=Phytophthora fragariaefolia TaxID=1490495 RepID=A0A9W6U6C7_9STRA|nr:unnamed protein product [Phytophthora fragariaefolia]
MALSGRSPYRRMTGCRRPDPPPSLVLQSKSSSLSEMLEESSSSPLSSPLPSSSRCRYTTALMAAVASLRPGTSTATGGRALPVLDGVAVRVRECGGSVTVVVKALASLHASQGATDADDSSSIIMTPVAALMSALQQMAATMARMDARLDQLSTTATDTSRIPRSASICRDPQAPGRRSG